MHDQFGDQVEFVGVAGAYPADDVAAFPEKYWVDDFAHVHDADGAIFEHFGVSGHPTTVYVGPDGSIERLTVGAASPQKLKERVGQLAAGEAIS